VRWLIVLLATVLFAVFGIELEITQSVPSTNLGSSRIVSGPTPANVLSCIITPLIVLLLAETNTAGAARKNVASTTSSDGSFTLSELESQAT